MPGAIVETLGRREARRNHSLFKTFEALCFSASLRPREGDALFII
jgi:hypothetical protein